MLPPPPPRREARNELKPPAAFRIPASRIQLRHLRAGDRAVLGGTALTAKPTWTDPVVLELCRRHGEPDPKRLILRLCQELLAECPTDRGPSPLAVLASCRGVRACRSGLIHTAAGCSGLLIPVDGGFEILVCSSQPEGRQNFSIAHEIIHTFFREVRPAATPSAEGGETV